MSQRDYNQEQRDNNRKYAYGFDFDVMHPYMLRSFYPFLKHSGKTLELGSYKGDFTARLLDYVSNVTCVEASSEAVGTLSERFGDDSRVTILHDMFENVILNTRFDNIILTHVLEHIDDPISLLTRIKKEWLAPNGKLFLVCPNANAPSRQIAVQMRLIEYNSAVTHGEKLHGHRCTYSFDTLENEARQAGLSIDIRAGIFFKPLANFQWDIILNQTEAISPEYLEGCYQLGQKYPDLCASIFLLCS